MPGFPGLLVFGMAFGAAAAQKGLSFAEALGLSTFVYAGAAQMVGLEVWQEVWTLGNILTLMTVTAIINARFLLLGATIHPWIRYEPLPRAAANLFLLTDASWIFSMRYRNEGGRDVGFLFGCGAALWVPWVAASVAGFFAGAFIPEPKRFGLDLVMPILFSVMLVPMWKGVLPALPWLAAGLVSLLVHTFVPGYTFIIAGALAGVATGMVMK
nr:AzlC family ABC transporter permease [Microvirga antarctica]